MPDKLKLGFVGCGMMGQLAHLENYFLLPNVEIVALAEGRPLLAEKVAQRYGIPKVYPSHRELCEDPEVEAVVAIMWFNLHYGVVRDLLMAGKHVATEKAMCLTPQGAEELASLAEQRGLVYQIGYMKRFDPGVLWAREQILTWRQSQEKGPLLYARIYCAHGDWIFQSPPPITTGEHLPDYQIPLETPPEGFTPEEFQWVEGWLNYYSHQTNLLRYILGEDYHLEYYHSGPGRDLILVQTDSGIPAFLEFPHYQVSEWDEGFKVYFQKGTVEAWLPAPLARQHSAQVMVKDLHGERKPYIPPRWGMGEQAKVFVEACLARDPSKTLSPPREAAKEIAFAYDLVKARRNFT